MFLAHRCMTDQDEGQEDLNEGSDVLADTVNLRENHGQFKHFDKMIRDIGTVLIEDINLIVSDET